MKKLKLGPLFWVLLAVCVVNMVGHLAVYPAMPDTVPTHWGASGEVNGWSSKQSNLIFCVLPLILLLFMEVVRRIDPKHKNFERFGKVWNIFITLFVLFTCGMTWLTELTVFDVLPGSSNMISIVVCGGIGVMFVILGNFMPNIKQNYTFGCRTPWALNDEHNWQRTQRMGGITFVVMGIALIAVAFLGGLLGDTVTLISGNDMGVLLLDYVCSHRKAQEGELPPVAVKTIVTTEMAVPICKKYGVELRNVLTGFKFIGEQIGLLEKEGHTDRYIFGFEESYGYLSGTSVRDKDAVNAAVLVCEMAANYKAQGLTLLDKLEQLREEFGFYAQRLLTFQYEGESGAAKMADIMRKLRAPLNTFTDAHFPTATRIDYQNDETGLPKSDVLSFALADGSKIIVRPSGTEPKLKAYLFARGENQAAAEKVLDELETLMNGYCKE